MENSMGVGLMAAFAVSGSVVLISTQFHKRLLSNFMDKIETELVCLRFLVLISTQFHKRLLSNFMDKMETELVCLRFLVLISTQFHKCLLFNFMDKIETELGGRRRSHNHGKNQRKMKRVRFAEDVTELSPVSDESYEEDEDGEMLGGMPVNRQILYKGIMDYRNMKDYHISTCI